MVRLPRLILSALMAGLLPLAGCGPKAAPEVTFVSLQGERIAARDLVGVIDKQGNIVSRTLGEADLAKFNALLEEKLKEP